MIWLPVNPSLFFQAVSATVMSDSQSSRGPSVLPYWRLSSFYFFYFCVVGAMVPYWGLYLKSLGYSSRDVGIIGAIILATRIIAPNFWGWLADRTQKRLQIIRVGSFAACAFFAGIFVDQTYTWLVLVVSAYTFFWHAVLPQFEVITLSYLARDHHRYGQIRLWGSIGFIAAVLVLGWLFDLMSVRYLPVFILTFLLLIGLSSISLKPVASHHPAAVPGGFWRIVTQPTMLCFLLMSFLLQLSHGPYYTFYSLYLIDNHGYSSGVTGLLWALGVLAEVVIFMVMHHLLRRCSLRNLLLWILMLTTVRWWLIAAFAQHWPLLLIAQLFHAGSFGVAHAVSMEMVRRYFGGAHQSQGQALYSSLSFGAGGALGALLGGMLWDFSAELTFYLCGLGALLAFFITYWGVFPKAKVIESSDS